MKPEALLETAFNLGMIIEKSETGEIIVRIKMQYNDNGIPEVIPPEPEKKKRTLRLVK